MFELADVKLVVSVGVNVAATAKVPAAVAVYGQIATNGVAAVVATVVQPAIAVPFAVKETAPGGVRRRGDT